MCKVFVLVLVGIPILLSFLYITLMTRADVINEYGSVKNYFVDFWEGIKEDIIPDCQKEKQEDETNT